MEKERKKMWRKEKKSASEICENHFKRITMPDKVKLLLIPYPKTEKHEIYNEIVKCLFEESFPSIETDIFLKYAKSQRDLR